MYTNVLQMEFQNMQFRNLEHGSQKRLLLRKLILKFYVYKQVRGNLSMAIGESLFVTKYLLH